jgi:hypothetical protein
MSAPGLLCPWRGANERQMMTDEFRPKLIAHLIAVADGNDQFFMDGTDGPIRDMLNSFDLMFAIWRDASEADGIGVLLLEGRRRVAAIVAGGQTGTRLNTTAFWCKNSNEAFWVAGQFKRVRRAGLG